MLMDEEIFSAGIRESERKLVGLSRRFSNFSSVPAGFIAREPLDQVPQPTDYNQHWAGRDE